MVLDRFGLGYTMNTAGGVSVHYPRRADSGSTTYGAGMDIGEIPPSYFTNPPNTITAERVNIWRGLRAADGEGG